MLTSFVRTFRGVLAVLGRVTPSCREQYRCHVHRRHARLRRDCSHGNHGAGALISELTNVGLCVSRSEQRIVQDENAPVANGEGHAAARLITTQAM